MKLFTETITLIMFACGVVCVAAWFWGTAAFNEWWLAMIRGAEPPQDALGKWLCSFVLFALSMGIIFALGILVG